MKISSMFRRLAVNTEGRDFLVGDVHGQMAMLDRLLEMVAFDTSRDRLIALGDLVDRGPDCAELLERVAREPWFYSLRGNHEAMMLEAARSREAEWVWSMNGNRWTETLDGPELAALCEVIKGLPIAIELPLADGRTLGLVHAEVKQGHDWNDLRSVELGGGDALDDDASTVAASALWGRTRIKAWSRMNQDPKAKAVNAVGRQSVWQALQPVAGIDLIVSGHSILEERCPLAVANLLYIDTGAYERKGRLTLVEPLARHYWQVSHPPHSKVRAIRLEPTALPPPVPIPAAYGSRTTDRPASRSQGA